ncbi:MAG TPA: hypothetical protein VFF65_00660, partial [Phycisphaerales bacterium]|nr:hypothetical protein [Phycisphaerales bacterium]
CVLIVRKLHPQAKVQIEIAQPWGEYTAEVSARASRSIPPAVYCELLNQVGVDFDAVALKVQMGVPLPGRSTRDMMALSALLDRYGKLDKPLALSVLGVPAAPVTSIGDNALEPGVWRRPWSPEQQGVWAARAMAIAAGKPYVRSICWQEIADGPAPCMAGGGLLNAQGQVRPAMTALTTLRESLRTRSSTLPGAD